MPGRAARHLADAKRPPPRVRLTVSKKPSGPFYKARVVGAGLARERERSSRQDARDFSSFSANSLSGILPAGKPAFRLQGKLPQPELRRMVLAVIWTRGGTAAK